MAFDLLLKRLCIHLHVFMNEKAISIYRYLHESYFKHKIEGQMMFADQRVPGSPRRGSRPSGLRASRAHLAGEPTLGLAPPFPHISDTKVMAVWHEGEGGRYSAAWGSIPERRDRDGPKVAH